MILSPFDPAALAPVAALFAKEPPVPAAARAPAYQPLPAPPDDEMRLTVDEAMALLPVGDVVHVIGEGSRRWSRADVRDALREAVGIRLTLPTTRAIGFGICADRRGTHSLVIETDTARFRAWLARQADKLAQE